MNYNKTTEEVKMYIEDFANRLSSLRIEQGISARDMSLSLGQSASYINRIENQKMLPSMTVFFYICEFLGITPAEFFSIDNYPSKDLMEAMKKLETLPEDKRKHILDVIFDL